MPDSASTSSTPSAELVRELKELIIEALGLQDLSPEDIDPDAPLLQEGLGLDSIDVLELAMALNKKYGIKTEADDERNREIFASVNHLARFLAQERNA